MIKKILLAIFLFAGSYLSVQAAVGPPGYKSPILHHIRGLQGIGASVGISSMGYKALAEWGYYFSIYSQIKIGVGGEWKNRDTLIYRSPFVQSTFNYTLYTNYKDLFLNILAGPIVHYASYQDTLIKLKESNFNVGVFVGGEIELFLIDNIALITRGGPTVYFLKNKYGRLGYLFNVSLQFNF